MKETKSDTSLVRIGNGLFNRRQFLALSAAAGGGLALAACGTDSEMSDTATEDSAEDSATETTEATTEVKTALRIGMNSSSVAESLTPVAIQGYVWSQMLGFVFYDPLIKKDDRGNLVPCLATEWDTTNPTKTVLKIREGVTFHDGTPLTAADVAYSIAVRSDPKLIETTQGRPLMTPEQWVSATAIDDRTVEVVTSERVEFLINPQPVLVIQNESFGKVNYANEVNGTGPYKLGKFTSGTGVECVANDAYWDGVPSIIDLSFTFYKDPATSATSLKSGQVDALYDVAPANIDSVSDIDGTVLSDMGTYAFWWIIQMGKEPLNDPAVRTALRHCFDIEAINQASFKGRGKFSWNPFKLFTVNSGADADVDFDPGKTKQLLADLGKSDITVPILCIEGYKDGVSAAQVMQQSFQAAGITCEVEVVPAQDWLDRTYGKGTWEGITFNAGNLPFPSKNFFDYLVNPSTILSAYKKGDVVEAAAELYRKINATPFDSPEISDLLAQAEKMIVDDAIVLMGLGAAVGLVLPEGVSGVVTNGFGDVFWDKAVFSA
jgi:peptide/nickel transport system substrate-binding protein